MKTTYTISPAPRGARSAERGASSFALAPQRSALHGLREQHLLGEDEVLAVVVGYLVLVAHGDRVEGAGDLAVAAEDSAGEVDLVHLRVSLSGRDPVGGVVLGGHNADAVGGAGGRAQRAADALLQPRVLEPVQLVAAAKAGGERDPLLGGLVRLRAFHPAR